MTTIPFDSQNCFHHLGAFSSTIGVFDGVHRAHVQLIEEIKSIGKQSLVVTFRENPKKVLAPQSYLGCLTTLDQKLEIFSSLGVEYCVLIDFSVEFSRISGRIFLDQLSRMFRILSVTVGEDFSFGKDRKHSTEDLEKRDGTGFSVQLMPPITLNGTQIRSSHIRKLIQSGEINAANQFLGRNFAIDLRKTEVDYEKPIHSDNLVQVLPEQGEYFGLDQLGNPGIVQISPDELHWKPKKKNWIKPEILYLKERHHVPFKNRKGKAHR